MWSQILALPLGAVQPWELDELTALGLSFLIDKMGITFMSVSRKWLRIRFRIHRVLQLPGTGLSMITALAVNIQFVLKSEYLLKLFCCCSEVTGI